MRIEQSWYIKIILKKSLVFSIDLIKQTKTSMDIFLSSSIIYNHIQKLILNSMKLWTQIEAKTLNLDEKM